MEGVFEVLLHGRCRFGCKACRLDVCPFRRTRGSLQIVIVTWLIQPVEKPYAAQPILLGARVFTVKVRIRAIAPLLEQVAEGSEVCRFALLGSWIQLKHSARWTANYDRISGENDGMRSAEMSRG